MNIGSIAWHIINVFVFIAWIECIVSWTLRGCPIPRWVHIFAGILLLAGVVSLIVLSSQGLLSLRVAASCLLIPPAASYIGWLWLFGPSEEADKRTK